MTPCLLDDIVAVKKKARNILDSWKITSEAELREIPDKIKNENGSEDTFDLKSEDENGSEHTFDVKDDNSEDETIKTPSLDVKDEETATENAKEKKKRKTEVEKLKIDDWSGPRSRKRNQPDDISVVKTSVATACTDCSDAKVKIMFLIYHTPAYEILLDENVNYIQSGENKFTMSGKGGGSEGSKQDNELYFGIKRDEELN